MCKTFDKCSNQADSITSQLSRDTVAQTSQNGMTTNVAHIKALYGSTTLGISGVALSTGLAKLKEKGQEVDVRLFFDNGSQKSFIVSSLVRQLKLPIKTSVKMTLNGFMGQPITQSYDIVKPLITMGNRKKRITAVVVDELPQTIVTTGLTGSMVQLREEGFKLADTIPNQDRVGSVDILIGADHYYDFISLRTIVHKGIHLLKSPSGYILTGNIPNEHYSYSDSDLGNESIIPESVLVLRITDNMDPLVGVETYLEEETEVHKLWDLDSLGIQADETMPDDRLSYQMYLDSLKYEDGQYWVRLPWKLNKDELPNNYSRALGQMHSLVKELKKKGKLEIYQKIIDEQLEAGFIEEVPDAKPNNKTHYLPHHGVVKDSMTTPLRIVFNCSSRAEANSPSLNDCLMTGPPLTTKLYDVLLKFRTNKYAYTADISKAFLRIGLQREDRDYVRFLWPADKHGLQ